MLAGGRETLRDTGWNCPSMARADQQHRWGGDERGAIPPLRSDLKTPAVATSCPRYVPAGRCPRCSGFHDFAVAVSQHVGLKPRGGGLPGVRGFRRSCTRSTIRFEVPHLGTAICR